MVLGILDEVPHNKEIIHIPHILDRIQLVGQAVLKLLIRILPVPFLQAFPAELLQIFPGRHPARDIILRQLGHAKFDLYRAAVRDLLCIVKCLQRIREQTLHLFRRLNVILAALIAHSIFVCQLLSRLDAQEDIVSLGVLSVGVVDVVCCDKLDPCLLGHLEKLLVHQRLIRQTVVLQLKEIIVFTENITVFKRSLFRLIVEPLDNIPLDLPGKTRAQGDDAAVILAQELFVHTRFIIISFHKAFGNNLHQIRISFIVLCQKDKMIISVVAARHFPVESGVWGHIDLAADDGIDPLPSGFSVEINNAVHHSVICDRSAVHAELFHS